MSLIKALMAQFGKSVTVANNFTLDASANNGTMRLARGNAGATTQDVLLIAADGKVDAPQGAKSAGSDVMRILQIPAKATTSGTFIDFSPADGSGIPAWAKEIDVILDGVSTSGISYLLIQLGTTALVNAGYISYSGYFSNAAQSLSNSATAGLHMVGPSAAGAMTGKMSICVQSANRYISEHRAINPTANVVVEGAGSITLTGVLDRIRVTTVNGTDTFDAGSVSIIVKG